MGSAEMAVNKILVLAVIVGSVAGQLTGTDSETSTPVPILRYLDQQNDDGSYTFGYESADGTYKIENRAANGQIKGKYGYIDANGDLQETIYDGTAEHGFAPRIGGVVVGRHQEVQGPRHNKIPVKDQEARPGSRFALYKARKAAKGSDLVEALPAVVEEPDYNDVDDSVNAVAVVERPAAQPQPRREQVQAKPRFANFRASNNGGASNNRQSIFHNKNVKAVNGRRVVLKKRPVAPAPSPSPRPAPVAAPVQAAAPVRAYVKLSPAEKLRKRQEEERALQQELRILEATRQATLRTHQNRYNIPGEAAKENLGYTSSIHRLNQIKNQQQPPQPQQQQLQVLIQNQRPFQQRPQPAVPVQQVVPSRTESFRSQNIAAQSQGFDPWLGHPYISGYNSGVGKYSYSY